MYRHFIILGSFDFPFLYFLQFVSLLQKFSRFSFIQLIVARGWPLSDNLLENSDFCLKLPTFVKIFYICQKLPKIIEFSEFPM